MQHVRLGANDNDLKRGGSRGTIEIVALLFGGEVDFFLVERLIFGTRLVIQLEFMAVVMPLCYNF